MLRITCGRVKFKRDRSDWMRRQRGWKRTKRLYKKRLRNLHETRRGAELSAGFENFFSYCILRWKGFRRNFSKHKRKTLNGAKLVKGFCGAPNRIRTCGLLIRSQTLYPAELWVRFSIFRSFCSEQKVLYCTARRMSILF